MSLPVPPQLVAAREQIAAVFEQVEKRKVDLLKESWADLEKVAVKVLGGPFHLDRPEHQVVALGLASALGERLAADHGAFWFPNRDTPEGAALGFPDALITLAPFTAVIEALSAAKLERLEDLTKEIRASLAQVKFSAAAGAMRLGPEDYMRLFDPGFIQLVALDGAKASQAWGGTPQKLASELRDGFNRNPKLPAELKNQLLGALQRLDQAAPLSQQVSKAPRVSELMGLLFAATATTGSAPEEFWSDMVLPLLFVGAPEKFPELDGDELEAAKQGIAPLFLFLEVVPYQFKAPDDGLMGAFPGDSLALPDPAFKAISNLRLVKVGVDTVKEPLAKFDAARSIDALRRFTEHLKAKTGPVEVKGEAEAKQMFEAALALLTDFKKVVEAGQGVCVRRLTENEASSEPALALLRQSLQGPRIILAT